MIRLRGEKRNNARTFKCHSFYKYHLMAQENQATNEVFMDTVSTKLTNQEQKIQLQDKRLAAVESKISGSPDYSGDLREIKASVQALRTDTVRLQFPMQKLEEFSRLLTAGIATLNQPPKTEIKHHHYVPGIIWSSIGLFVMVCLTTTGWFITARTMDRYSTNDIKYRQLRLVADSAFSAYLFRLDSVYEAAPDSFKDAVLEKERLKEERLELLERFNNVNKQIDHLNGKDGERGGTK